MPPPVAITLMTSAPCSMLRRTTSRIASAPSASPPRNQQCPPGAVTGVPAARMQGPGSRPPAMSSRRRTASPSRSPRSRTVATPEPSSRRARSALPRLSSGVEHEVYVGVDQSRQERAAGIVEPTRPAWCAGLHVHSGADVGDDAASDQDGCVGDVVAARAEQYASCRDDGVHRCSS
jgi:hypothetical protein